MPGNWDEFEAWSGEFASWGESLTNLEAYWAVAGYNIQAKARSFDHIPSFRERLDEMRRLYEGDGVKVNVYTTLAQQPNSSCGPIAPHLSILPPGWFK